nr:MAG TPA: hypothetical protein [Caudoviricetes sp.]
MGGGCLSGARNIPPNPPGEIFRISGRELGRGRADERADQQAERVEHGHRQVSARPAGRLSRAPSHGRHARES